MPKPIVGSNPIAVTKSKHTKFGEDSGKEIDVAEDIEIEPRFMKGDLDSDLKLLINSLDLPKTVPSKGQVTKAEKLRTPPVRAAAISLPPPKSGEPKGTRKHSSTDVAPKHERFEARERIQHPTASKGKGRLIIEPTALWYQSVPKLSPVESVPELAPDVLRKITTEADTLLKQEADLANSDPSSVNPMGSSDQKFLAQILHAGTSSDRLSALTLLAQASPVHNQRALESLKNMASKKGRTESLKAFKAIVDLWVGGAAPNRKLKYFVDQPLGHPDKTDKHLIYWAFEDWLKKYFFSLLQVLERLTLDTLPYIRIQATALVFTLLKDRPEQEQNLLRLLVNKLGDADKSVASKASFYLLQLLQVHPSMKAVVVREISSLLLRPTSQPGGAGVAASAILATQHARYYGILTFTQITLAHTEPDVAQLLVTLYFELFVTLLSSPAEPILATAPQEPTKKGKPKAPETEKDTPSIPSHSSKPKGEGAGFAEAEDSSSKLVAALLTGVNRALPFAKMDDTIFDQHIDTLFRITHTATFNVSIQALVLILQIATSRPAIQDRFYRTLYESLLDVRLAASSKQAMYLNLLHKAWKLDNNLPRLCGFVKRFLQTLGMHQPSFICGGMFLLGEIFTLKPALRALLQRVEDDTEDESSPPPSSPSKYDPRKRDPQGAGAESEPLWEMAPLLHHFHPSVALHARQLLDEEPITTTAELTLHTVSSFLDRFITKGPKKFTPKGTSLMQPGAAQEGTVLVRQLRGVGVQSIDEQALRQKPADQVSVDQLFFHQYLQQKRDTKSKGATTGSKKVRLDDARDLGSDAEAGSGTDEEEEAEIWKAMKNSMPRSHELPGEDDDISEDGIPSDLGSGPEDDDLVGEIDLEDADDLVDSDTDNLGPADESSESGEDDAWGGVRGQKRKGGDKDSGPTKKKRKMATLPTFASYDDYAKMIDEAPEEDI